MKIAVTCENGMVFQHFGHTPEFAIYEAEGEEITAEYRKPTGDSGHSALAGFLAAERVDVVICGGIGGGAIQALTDAGIKVVGGASGPVRWAAEGYLSGKLQARADFLCHHHDGENHTCGPHGCGSHSCH